MTITDDLQTCLSRANGSLRRGTNSAIKSALMWAATLALSRKHTSIGGCLINLSMNGSLKNTNNYPLTFQKNLNN